MLSSGRRILVSAISIAEALRYPFPRVVPRADRARRRTMTVDAMIVATAVRHRADMIVSIDADFVKLAKRAGIDAKTPEDFRNRQIEIDL
jgi:predicted nucleic acid-binding protein